ncbi:MAG: PEP-CTERM sorting domain-containing protein [Planctomycetota bacterium]
MKSARLATLFCTFLFTASLLSAAEVTFFDGDFEDAEWTLVERHFLSAGTEIRRFTTGGNPDAYLSIANRGNDRASQTQAFYFKNDALFDPGTQGAISQINYAEDSRFITNGGFTNSRIQAFSLGVRQAGLTYFIPNGGDGITHDGTDWDTKPLTILDSDEFWLANADGSIDVNSHPDFSVNGDEIQFGFFRANSAGGSPSYVIESAIDNWSVAVQTTAVPEPSSIAVISSVVATCVLRRRKRAKRFAP